MNQLSLRAIRSSALRGALYMVLAGTAFALVNVAIQKLTMEMGVGSASAAFWQYFIAMAFSLPVVFRFGLRRLKTKYLTWHLTRIVLAVAGIQFWVAGLAHVPIWQAIALVMTSPFFVTLGAIFYLREAVNPTRWLALAIGFAGALVILDPWADGFSPYTLLPVIAAALWAGSSLLTKRLTQVEDAQKITVYLLALLLPVNAVFAGVGGGFGVPVGDAIWLLIGAGLLTALAQYLLARAYECADASYIQPFDHLKLPLNVLAGWLVFGYLPNGNLWLGAVMIIGASIYVMQRENK